MSWAALCHTPARTTLSAALSAAVSAGTATQADMDAELAEFDAATTQSVYSTTFGVRGGGGFGPGRHGGPGGRGGPDGEPLISAAASVTGLTAQEVITQLQAGQSLAQIAQANGKTADEVIQAARTQLVTRLAQAVTDGKITRSSNVRIRRNNEVVFTGKVASLKNVKQDVREMNAGQDCGLQFDGWTEFKAGDVVEAYDIVQVN